MPLALTELAQYGFTTSLARRGSSLSGLRLSVILCSLPLYHCLVVDQGGALSLGRIILFFESLESSRRVLLASVAIPDI